VAFYTVGVGATASRKSFYYTPGNIAVVPVTVGVSPAHVDPVSGLQPCVTAGVGAALSGGTMYLCVWGNGLVGGVISSLIDAAGGVDAYSSRTYYYTAINRAFYPGIQVLGVICQSEGVGILTEASAGPPTVEYTSAAAYVDQWSGAMNIGMDYNTVPSAPQSLIASSPGPGVVDLSWSYPANDSGLVVNGYRIEWSTDNFATLAGSIFTTGNGTRSRQITGLDPGTYKFRTAALNAVSNAFGVSKPSGGRSNVATITLSSGARRWNGSSEISTTAVMRWNGSTEVPVTTAVRWNGSAEVPLS
jgi:hypothetical protein